jgi:hypothetical protein
VEISLIIEEEFLFTIRPGNVEIIDMPFEIAKRASRWKLILTSQLK